jgi:hypothetical protein
VLSQTGVSQWVKPDEPYEPYDENADAEEEAGQEEEDEDGRRLQGHLAVLREEDEDGEGHDDVWDRSQSAQAAAPSVSSVPATEASPSLSRGDAPRDVTNSGRETSSFARPAPLNTTVTLARQDTSPPVSPISAPSPLHGQLSLDGSSTHDESTGAGRATHKLAKSTSSIRSLMSITSFMRKTSKDDSTSPDSRGVMKRQSSEAMATPTGKSYLGGFLRSGSSISLGGGGKDLGRDAVSAAGDDLSLSSSESVEQRKRFSPINLFKKRSSSNASLGT